MESRSDAAVKVPKGVESFRPESSSGMTAYFPDIPIKTVYVRLGSRLCKNSPFSKIAKIFTTLTKLVMYMPAGYATLWQYCSSSRFNSPLLKNTFCFHTASARSRRSCVVGWKTVYFASVMITVLAHKGQVYPGQ